MSSKLCVALGGGRCLGEDMWGEVEEKTHQIKSPGGHQSQLLTTILPSFVRDVNMLNYL